MEYNRRMIADMKENKLLRKAARDATTQFILLMNQYHACDLRYFPSDEKRIEAKREIEKGINRLKSRLPSPIRSNMQIWMDDPALWRDSVDRLWI